MITVLQSSSGGVATDLRVPSQNLRIVLYVRPGGSDVTGNGSLTAPYATFERACDDVMQFSRGGQRVVIDITGCDLTLTDGFRLPPIISDLVTSNNSDPGHEDILAYEGTLTVRAQPTTLLTLTAGDIVSQTQDAVSGILTITTNLTWTVDQWKGKLLLGVPGSYEYAVICSNTVNALEVAWGNWGWHTFTPPFRICDQGGTLRAPATGWNAALFSSAAAALQFAGVRLLGGSGWPVGFRTRVLAGRIDFEGCDIHGLVLEGTGYVLGAACYIHGPNLSTTVPLYLEHSFFESCAMTIYGDTGTNGHTFGYCVFSGCKLGTYDRNYCALIVEHANIRNAPSGVAGFFISCSGARSQLNYANVTNCVSGGVQCWRGAISMYKVAGTGNTGYGLSVKYGGRVFCGVSANANTVTGSLGDMKVGGLVTRTWSDFYNAVPPSGRPSKCETDLAIDIATGTKASGDLSQVGVF